MCSDTPESTPPSSAVADGVAPEDALTRVELFVELRQSIGRQLYGVLTRPTRERTEAVPKNRHGG